jgi:hypothetical protein
MIDGITLLFCRGSKVIHIFIYVNRKIYKKVGNTFLNTEKQNSNDWGYVGYDEKVLEKISLTCKVRLCARKSGNSSRMEGVCHVNSLFDM